MWHFKDAKVYDPSPFMNHLQYSIFLAVAAMILLNRLISSKYSIKEKIFYAFFFMTVTGNLFLIMGRTGQVAFIFTIFLLFFLHYRLSIKAILMAFFSIIFIFVTAYNQSQTFHNRTKETLHNIEKIIKHDYNTNLGIRVLFYIVVPKIIKNELFLGVGIGDHHLALQKEINKQQYSFLDEYTKSFIAHQCPHSQYLLILLQLGIIGETLFLLFIFYYYKTILKIKDREMKELGVLFMTIYLLSFLSDAFLLAQFTLTQFFFFSAVFIANSINNN